MFRPIRLVAGVALVTILLGAVLLRAEEWPRFRGPDGSGISEIGFPAELSPEKNLRWKVECGKGASSPIVAGDRVFVTAFEGLERMVQCFHRDTGATLWTRPVQSQRKEVATAPGGPASPTPVADETNVYAFFPDVGIGCWTHAGEERWQIPLGPFQSFHGVAASLVVAEGQVVVLVDQLQDSYLAAFDCGTGKETWRVSRHDGPIGGYSTPTTRKTAQGKVELVVSGPLEVVGYDAKSGQRNWSVEGVSNAPISNPVVAGNRVLLCEPSFSENPFKIDSLLGHDKNQDGLLSQEELASRIPLQRIAKRIDAGWGNGDGLLSGEEMEQAFKSFVGGGGLVALQIDEQASPATARTQWTYRKSVPQIPSLLVHRDVLFFISDGGILTSMDPENGNILKRARLNHGSSYYASPVAASGQIMVIDTEGKIAVTTAEAEWRVLATGDLGEKCYATPAIADGIVIVRTEKSLFCFRGEAS